MRPGMPGGCQRMMPLLPSDPTVSAQPSHPHPFPAVQAVSNQALSQVAMTER